MFEQKDWVMRQIEMLGKFLSKLFFGSDTVSYEILDETVLSTGDLLYRRLHQMIADGEIGKAEDLLFEKIDSGQPEQMRLVLDFYQTLSALPDETLEAGNFSRQEIHEGLEEMAGRFGVVLG
jgi:hypothetical protein